MQKKQLSLAQKVHHSTNSNTTVVKSSSTTNSLQRKWSKENALGADYKKTVRPADLIKQRNVEHWKAIKTDPLLQFFFKLQHHYVLKKM